MQGGRKSVTSLEDAPTPIPYKKVAILGLILAANNTSIWMIFSFLPFMVQHFFPYLTSAELGYHAGMLGSAFSAGALLGNVFWGIVSDKLGRRPAMLLGLFGTAVCALWFGFSSTFLCAVFSRFMWGLLNGNIGVAKTYLGEVSDDSNAAKGMALFGVIGGFGRTVGPIIGGFLSTPARSYPNVFANTIFETYPFALPSVVISVNCIIVFVVAYFTLPETLPADQTTTFPALIRSCFSFLFASVSHHQSSLSSGSDETAYALVGSVDSDSSGVELQVANDRHSLITDDDNANDIPEEESLIKKVEVSSSSPQRSALARSTTSKTKRRPKSVRLTFSNVVRVRVIDEQTFGFQALKGIGQDESPVSTDVAQSTFVGDADAENPQPTRIDRFSNGSDDETVLLQEKRTYWNILRQSVSNREVLISTMMYGTNALVSIVINEIFPLWVVTSRSQGGFEFHEHEIGISTMITGICAVILQISLYPMLVDKFGVLNVIKISIFLTGVGCFLTPAVSVINEWHAPALEWICIVLSQLLLGVASTWVLISVFVLINNSCYSYQRATVNGLGQTFASLGRLCGPYAGAVLFAWSETNGMSWPLNYYFVFYLLVIIGIGNWCLTNMLPYRIQRRKREPVIPTDEQVDEYLRSTATQPLSTSPLHSSPPPKTSLVSQ